MTFIANSPFAYVIRHHTSAFHHFMRAVSYRESENIRTYQRECVHRLSDAYVYPVIRHGREVSVAVHDIYGN